MSATLKDISQLTGVSVAAISLVLNDKPCRIAEDTKLRIRDAAVKLNYQPNKNAVALVTNCTMKIGVVVYDIVNTFFAEVAKGIEVEAGERGYGILLVNMMGSESMRQDYLRLMGYDDIDGLIVVSSVDESPIHEYVNSFIDLGKPVAVVSNGTDDILATNIRFKNNKGSHLATKHLLDLGHKKIGCITGPLNVSQDRLYGYIQALQEYDVMFDQNFVATGDYQFESGHILSKGLVEKGVSAILACNDLMAYGVYRMAEENGIQIPQDLSVVGFDDLMYSSLMSVPLTSVKQPAYEIGKSACEKVLEMIETKKQSLEDVLFEPELIIRKSTCKKL